MSLNIKDEETHRLVRELAQLTGESQTTAVMIAVRERLDRLHAAGHPSLADRLLAIGRNTAPRLKEPFRSTEHGELLYDERGAPAMAQAIEEATQRQISAANWLEAAAVIDGSRDPVASRQFDDLIGVARILVAPVTEQQARIARAAYRDFGKGSGHPAGLNFGDCFAYALAKDTGEPLLFKGRDFARTDIVPALQLPDPA